MIPLQDIYIYTSNKSEFRLLMEQSERNIFHCSLAVRLLFNNNNKITDDIFPMYNYIALNCITAEKAFEIAISKITNALNSLNPQEKITVIDNPCNTELIDITVEQKYVSPETTLRVNGKP